MRLLSGAFRRYSRDPATREHSARMFLVSAVSLYAEQTSAGDAALTAAETLATIVQAQRRGDR